MTDWLDREPGLRAASDQWLTDLDMRLAQARRRANRIIRADPVTAGTLPRLAQLVRGSAPRLAPALLRRDGEEIVKALAETALNGGPTYVKLGQFISSTRGLVPDWIADAFAGCRDEVPPAKTALIAAVLDRSGIIDQIAEWDPTPLASASVAQVHRATLNDGREIVLKIRRPGIGRIVASDAAYLLPLLGVLESRDERFKVANLRGTTVLMLRLFAQEVDLRLEATSAVQLATAFERAGFAVQVPTPIPSLVTEKVLGMEFVPGVSAADVDGAQSFQRAARDLVRLAVVGTLHTTMNDGIFHGDLHLGNVLVNDRGLALVDYGIVGRLTETQRRAIAQILVAGLADDRAGLFAGLKDFGALPAHTNVEDLLRVLPDPPSFDERMAMLNDPSLIGDRMTDLVRNLSAAGFKVPPELTLFFRNVVYLGDAIQRHAPEMDLITEIGGIVTEVLATLDR
ncbi:MAG TPA: AarF/UbiB family protein [Acidimicrobiales bacterium]|nr:AarF/UbiB family protein [Acidimicrobiales bacterium]